MGDCLAPRPRSVTDGPGRARSADLAHSPDSPGSGRLNQEAPDLPLSRMLFCARHRSCADAPDRAFGATGTSWPTSSAILTYDNE